MSTITMAGTATTTGSGVVTGPLIRTQIEDDDDDVSIVTLLLDDNRGVRWRFMGPISLTHTQTHT